MSASFEYQITLKQRQHQYLSEMAKKYGLEDEAKALRCLIDYAIDRKGEEASIFKEIRCMDC